MANALLEFRLILVILLVLILPGYALLGLSNLWRHWPGLQKLSVATALGIAIYPVGFYALSQLPAFFTLGPYTTGLLLLLCAAFVLWRNLREPGPKFQSLEWIGLAVVVLTLGTRWAVAHAYPYPAWTDSLHHTLLTELIATQGRLPATLDPYFPVPLGMYHLGLHAIAAVVMWLAQVPAHTALLWTAQTLNGLCGIGVYFVLDRLVGRAGALVGVVTVGLISYQPAFYVNWGRYTQVASQAILLVGWCVTHETIVAWPTLWPDHKRRTQLWWLTIFASLLSAAIFLLHFRVASMYILLVAVGLLTSFRALRGNKAIFALVGLVGIGVISLLFISPALWAALRIYIQLNRAHIPPELVTAAQIAETQSTYYQFRWSDLDLASHTWLLVLTVVAAVIGLLRRNQVTILSLLWTAVLYLLGNAYVLGIPILNITNLGAILIMLYLPCALICGAAVEELTALFKDPWRSRLTQLIVSGVLLGGLLAMPARVNDIEAFRYFVTPNDVDAMQWIQANTPKDALFAVNTHFWTPALPHGTDAGYWIPYFTGRKITAGVMLLNLAAYDYQIKILNLSRTEQRLETDLNALAELQAQGANYIYIGERGNFAGLGLKAEQLKQSDKLELVYQKGNVFIFHLKFP